MAPRAAARVVISGRVQGVGFRYHARETARSLGLTGYVKNLADGRVEALFVGEREGVERAVAWCRQGPPRAWVEAVELAWETPPAGQEGFLVRF